MKAGGFMKKKTVGGQALIEGVMMKNRDLVAVAVRKPNGEIEVEKRRVDSFMIKHKIDKIPFLRGCFALFESMEEGINSLTYSASFYEEGSEDSFDKMMKKIFKENAEKVVMGLSIFLALGFSIGIFILLPTLIGGIMKSAFGGNSFFLNMLEGIFRISIFFLYVFLVSKNKEIYRVFQYHGAEHKTIFCYESDEELTVENVKKYGRLHPRCGTNFMFIVLVVSTIFFSLWGWPNPIVRIAMRLIFLPIVAGISYEIIKLAGNCKNSFLSFFVAPGLWLQKITTQEPEEDQIEVAIASLKAVIEGE